jgi:streptogramin lyase
LGGWLRWLMAAVAVVLASAVWCGSAGALPLGQAADWATAADGLPGFMTSGPDGNLWFTEDTTDDNGTFPAAGLVGVLVPCAPVATCTPLVRDFPTPTAASEPEGIVAGPDGDLWFTEFHPGVDQIGVIVPCTPIATCTPTIREFATPAGGKPYGIAVGPDGNLWFAEFQSSRIGVLVPCTPIATCTPMTRDFPTETQSSGGNFVEPYEITAGADGNM